MRLRSTTNPVWFGREYTLSALVPFVAVHRIIRHNTIPAHALPLLEIALVESGHFQLVIDGKRASVGAGQLVVIPARAEIRSGGGMNAGLIYWIGVDIPAGVHGYSDQLRQELDQLAQVLNRRSARPITAAPAVFDAVKRCIDLYRAGETRRLRLESAALLLVSELSCVLSRRRGPDLRERALIEPALRLIADNLHRRITLDELCDCCNMSLPTLSGMFRLAVGLSPRAYINRARVERAGVLLSQGKSVTQVARLLDFGSSQYLATVFRKVTGLSPTAHRHDANV